MILFYFNYIIIVCYYAIQFQTIISHFRTASTILIWCYPHSRKDWKNSTNSCINSSKWSIALYSISLEDSIDNEVLFLFSFSFATRLNTDFLKKITIPRKVIFSQNYISSFNMFDIVQSCILVHFKQFIKHFTEIK